MNKTAATISKAVGAAGAIALVSLAAVFGVQQIRDTQAAHAEAVEQAQIAEAEQAEFDALVVKFSSPGDSEVVKVPTPPPAPVVEAPVQEAPQITYCPEGTVAGAVDAAGNESACQELSSGGEQCVAYDDANNCTQWYKP